MTLVVAICTGNEEINGLLISSDSQATVGPVTYRVHKIIPIELDEQPLAIAAGAGDSALIKKAVAISKDFLIENSIKEWDEKTPSSDQFEQTVSRIELDLIDKISVYRQKGLNISFDFMLGSVSSEGKVSLYLFDQRGVMQPVHDDPGFACIGSGFYLGGNLLLQQFYSPDLDWLEAMHLAAYVINQVSMVDATVGPFEGESWFFRSEAGEPVLGDLLSTGFQRIRNEYNLRRKLLKYVWEHSRLVGTRKLHKLIRQGIKEMLKKNSK